MSRQDSELKINWQKLLKIPSFLLRGIKYYAAGRVYIPKPTRFGLAVTDRCNARCVMCSFWKKKPSREPGLDDIHKIFSNSLLDRLDTVVLSGGEPIVREDLVELTQNILRANHGIKRLDLITNGLRPELLEKRIKEMLKLPEYNRLQGSTIVVSLDGIGEVHDKIRGVTGAFERVVESIKCLKKLPLRIVVNSTIQKSNFANLHQISSLASKLGVEISFRPVTIKISDRAVFSQEQAIDPDGLMALRAMFEDQVKLRLLDRVFWQDCFRVMSGNKRRLPCAIPYRTIFMSANGDLYICGMYDQIDQVVYGNAYEESIDKIWYSRRAEQARKMTQCSLCPACVSPCEVSFSLGDEVFYFARYLLKEKIKWLRRRN